MIYKLNSFREFLFFCTLFVSFFSLSFLPVNPVYLLGFGLIFISLVFHDFKRVLKGELIYLLYFLTSLISLWIGSYYFSLQGKPVEYATMIIYLYCILLGYTIIVLGKEVHIESRKRIYIMLYNILIVFFMLELMLRFLFPDYTDHGFYVYKASLFYLDSNFAALVLSMFIMYSLFLKENKIVDIGKAKFLILIILLILTFSRGAIFAVILSYLLFRYTRKYMTYIVLIGGILSLYVFNKLLNIFLGGANFVDFDGSFNSKFNLIYFAMDNYDGLPLINKWFGIGVGNFLHIADKFAHNILITLFFEFGYIGTISLLIFLGMMYYKVGKDIFYLVIPLFVAGFTLFSAYMPFFFVLLACMYIDKLQVKER